MKTNRLAVPTMILLFGLAACSGEYPAEYHEDRPIPVCPSDACLAAPAPAPVPVDPSPIDEPLPHCPRGEMCEPVE